MEASGLAAPLQLFQTDGDLLRKYEDDEAELEREWLLPSAPGRRFAVGRAEQSRLSKALFLWVTPMLTEGGKRQLSPDDLFEVPPECETAVLAAAFGKHLEAEMARPPRGGKLPPTYYALSSTFGPACALLLLVSPTLYHTSRSCARGLLQACYGPAAVLSRHNTR